MVRLESGHDSSLSLSLQEKKNDSLEQDMEKKKDGRIQEMKSKFTLNSCKI